MLSVADLASIKSVAKLKLLILALASGVTRPRNKSLMAAGSTGVVDDTDTVAAVGDGVSEGYTVGTCVEIGLKEFTIVVAEGLCTCMTGVGKPSLD